MLKVFSTFAVFLHYYVRGAEPKFYLVQTQAQADSWGTEGEDFKWGEREPEKPRKYSGHTETEPGFPRKHSGHTETEPGIPRKYSGHTEIETGIPSKYSGHTETETEPRKDSGHTGLSHIKTKCLHHRFFNIVTGRGYVTQLNWGTLLN